MRELNCLVKDKNTLVLLEDGSKDDYIDLTKLTSVDTSAIEAAITAQKDKIYNSKLEEFKRTLVAEAKLDKEKTEASLKARIAELENLINKNNELTDNQLKHKENEKIEALKLKEEELKNKYEVQILELENTVKALTIKSKTDIESVIAQLNAKHTEELNKLNEKLAVSDANKNTEITKLNAKNNIEINELNAKHLAIVTNLNKQIESVVNQLNILKAQYDTDLKNKELELNNKYQSIINELTKNSEIAEINKKNEFEKLKVDHLQAIEDTKRSYEDKINSLNETVLGLQRQRASLNSKMIGEDLEVWCTNEYLSYAQNGGFDNCLWTKDNKVVRNADEVKGSKGDFVLECYATSEHLENEMLTNILFEMKNESPDTKTKHHNSDFYEQLDKNRIKKNCKYAVLVSDLDRGGNNELPMARVLGYKDMYVVRPEYMLTFINIITSITTKFTSLILNKGAEELNLKTKKEIMAEFDKIKESYLDNQLAILSKDIAEIEKQTGIIITSATKINSSIEDIKNKYINNITNKLETYSLKLTKLSKKLEE